MVLEHVLVFHIEMPNIYMFHIETFPISVSYWNDKNIFHIETTQFQFSLHCTPGFHRSHDQILVTNFYTIGEPDVMLVMLCIL